MRLCNYVIIALGGWGWKSIECNTFLDLKFIGKLNAYNSSFKVAFKFKVMDFCQDVFDQKQL